MHPRTFVAAAIVAIGCSAPTTITSTWKDPSYAAGPMHKLLVYGAGMSETNRHELEDRYVSALGKHGVQAVASYRVFPDTKTDRQIVKSYLQDEHFDGALVSAFVGIDQETRMVREDAFDSYYGQTLRYEYRAATDDYVKVETTLWEARGGRKVWSVVSRTQNPASSSEAVSSVVKNAVASLLDERLIATR